MFDDSGIASQSRSMPNQNYNYQTPQKQSWLNNNGVSPSSSSKHKDSGIASMHMLHCSQFPTSPNISPIFNSNDVCGTSPQQCSTFLTSTPAYQKQSSFSYHHQQFQYQSYIKHKSSTMTHRYAPYQINSPTQGQGITSTSNAFNNSPVSSTASSNLSYPTYSALLDAVDPVPYNPSANASQPYLSQVHIHTAHSSTSSAPSAVLPGMHHPAAHNSTTKQKKKGGQRFSRAAKAAMLKLYNKYASRDHAYPSDNDIKELAIDINEDYSRVKKWLSNHRFRDGKTKTVTDIAAVRRQEMLEDLEKAKATKKKNRREEEDRDCAVVDEEKKQ